MATQNNPGWGMILALGVVAAGAAYVYLKRPDFPGEWDEWLYAQLPSLPSGTIIQTHAGEPDGALSSDGSTSDPLIGDVEMTIA